MNTTNFPSLFLSNTYAYKYAGRVCNAFNLK